MHVARTATGRPPIHHSFRHPLVSTRHPSLIRPFTQDSPLLLISSAKPFLHRPELPYLAAISPTRQNSPAHSRNSLHRLLTTEAKSYLKQQALISGKIILFTSLIAVSGLAIAFGINNEYLERKYPSPRSWTLISRISYRSARWNEEPNANGSGLPDWAHNGDTFRQLLGRLENPELDGQDLRSHVDGEGILIPGVGSSGLDISLKTYEWRQGYYDTLRGCARAAEHLDGWKLDTTRRIVFPENVVVGLSNPDPRPCPPGAALAPREEDCIQAFDPPEKYYMKILTTRGFSTRQRLDAALAYADWCEFKHLDDTAREMYRWGMDIALEPLSSATVDRDTGVLSAITLKAQLTDNVLLATTALGTYFAKTGEAAKALPVFLSLLRARRSLPDAPPLQDDKTATAKEESTFPILRAFLNLLTTPPPYPAEPPSGDTPAMRTQRSICEEAGLMTYVGELLFATSDGPKAKEQGVGWTKEAVDVAEAQMQLLSQRTEERSEAKERCKECLATSLQNWKTMVMKMESAEMDQKPHQGSWGFKSATADIKKWANERRTVETREKELRLMLVDDDEVLGVGLLPV